MLIKINGKDEDINKPLSLSDLISKKGLTPGHIVVEHNFKIIPKEEWSGVRLADNDKVEIVSFVGGG